MAPQRYPNKLKRSGYWARYDGAGVLDFKKVWNLVLALIGVLLDLTTDGCFKEGFLVYDWVGGF